MPPNMAPSSQQQLLPLLPHHHPQNNGGKGSTAAKHIQERPPASYSSIAPDEVERGPSSSLHSPPSPPPPPPTAAPIIGSSKTPHPSSSPHHHRQDSGGGGRGREVHRRHHNLQPHVPPPPPPPPRQRRLSTTPRPHYRRKRSGASTSTAGSPSCSSHHGHDPAVGNHHNDDNHIFEEPEELFDDDSLFTKVKTPGENFHADLADFVPGSIPHSAIVALTIGIVCGVSAYLYYTVLEYALDALWRDWPEQLLRLRDADRHHGDNENNAMDQSDRYFFDFLDPTTLSPLVWIPLVVIVMGIGVGASVRLLGEPGDLPMTIRCVHETAYVSLDHVLPMVVASQCSILGGASLGPEAPLVAICAALAGGVSQKVFQTTDRNLVRKHTLMGMSGALAAFFGCPLGGSLFALEVNSRFGIEYFEHTVEAVFCGEVCLAVFRALARLPIAPIWHLTENKLASTDSIHICYGALLGLVGAATAALFTKFHFNTLDMFQRAGLLKEENAVLRALCGAVVIASLGLVLPATLFWGEYEFQTIATGAPATTLPHVWPKTNGFLWGEPREGETDGPLLSLLVGLGKLVAISFSVCGGYRGGFIFPLFCSGAAFGRAVHFFLPGIPLQLCVLCLAAALNVAVTRTCISTTLILAFLAGEPNAISAILAAALASLFATAYMPFIKTQVARADIESSIFILDYSAVAATMGPVTATATTGDMDDTANSDPLTPFSADGMKTGSRHQPDYGSSTTIAVDV